ncbi:RNA ligase family protein [Brevibacillus massiliensis]|uniref:ATP-dependent DNA ligase n=1 Tax=Brevibacillus massiliensis TaxID=1118054 RepID=UPI000315C169|nr:RNA ligase family protein [Brevibacillus massiliensis]
MFISPMLLEQVDAPFSDDQYIFEPKIDGHRLILSRINGVTKLYTRHNNDVTAKYPELISDGPNVILDGEVVVLDPETGYPDFELTMQRFQSKSAQLPVSYVVFDIMRYQDTDLQGLPLLERKSFLDRAVTDSPTVCKIAYVDGRGEDLYQAIVARKMEGVVAKRKDSAYAPGKRVDTWLKIVNYSYANVYITGYRKGEFGWLASIYGNDGRLRPAGIIELGVPPAHKTAFRSVCGAIITGEDRDYVYLEPKITARVKFRNWTRKGMLRSPVFVDFVLIE